jgi:MFS family permease
VVRAAGFVSFFTDMGSEIIYPVMPSFLRQLGASRLMIGWIEGVAEGLPSFIKLLSGAWSDRVRNRKWMVFAGYFLSTVMKPFIAVARIPSQVFGLRLLDRVGKGIRTAPRDALVADHTDPRVRGGAFGFQRAMDHAGAVTGGLICFFMLATVGLTIRRMMLWSLLPGILALLTIVFFLNDRPGRSPAKKGGFSLKGLRDLPRHYFIYVAVASVFTMANSSDAFLLLRCSDMGVRTPVIPLLWAFLHLVKTVTSLWGGRLSDRIGRWPVLLIGWVLYGWVYLGFVAFDSPAAAWFLFAFYGVFFGMTEGASRAVIADMVPEGRRGTAFGFWGMVEGCVLVAASLVTGGLWDLTGGALVPFTICGALSLSASVLLAVLWRSRSLGGVGR